jgi:hypothetical protein
MGTGHTFYVSVQLAVVMQVHQSLQQLFHDDGDLCLCYQAGLHQVRTAAARAELHNYPQVGAVQVRAVVSGHVWRAHARQYHDLAHDIFHLVFSILDVDDLDGDCVSRPPVEPLVHLAEAAPTYAFLLREQCGRVYRLVPPELCRHLSCACCSAGDRVLLTVLRLRSPVGEHVSCALGGDAGRRVVAASVVQECRKRPVRATVLQAEWRVSTFPRRVASWMVVVRPDDGCSQSWWWIVPAVGERGF